MAVVQNTRVSPGVYRNAQGQLVRSATSSTPSPTQNPAAKPTATGSNPQNVPTAARNPNEFVRISAGMYRDTKTGKVVRGKSNEQLAQTWSAEPSQPKTNQVAGNPDASATRVGSGQWKLADGRVVNSAGRPKEGQFGAVTPTPAPVTEELPERELYQKTPEMSDDMKQFLFPTTDMANDPVHQNSLKRGEEALNRRLSASGLMGSGREFELARDMTTDLETASQARYNEQRQENAGRLATFMENQANRNSIEDEREWRRILDTVKLQMEQNPAQYGQWAMNEANGVQGDINKTNQANTSNQYRTVVSGGGGAAPVRSTVPNGSNDALLALIRAQGGARNADALSGLLGSIGTTVGSIYGNNKKEAA